MHVLRRLSIILALLGILLVTSGLAYGAYQRAIATPGPAPLPPTLAELPIVEEQSGPEAAQNIAHLHRQTFPLSGAAVGTYRDAAGSATLWVSESPLAPLAGRMEQAMEEAIAAGNSPFIPEATRQVEGRAVRVLTGMGQKHYYFRSGKLVVWLAADEALAQAALADVLAFYR